MEMGTELSSLNAMFQLILTLNVVVSYVQCKHSVILEVFNIFSLINIIYLLYYMQNSISGNLT